MINGVEQPAPAPRFSKTPLGLPTPPQAINAQNTWNALEDWMTPEKLKFYAKQGVIDNI